MLRCAFQSPISTVPFRLNEHCLRSRAETSLQSRGDLHLKLWTRKRTCGLIGADTRYKTSRRGKLTPPYPTRISEDSRSRVLWTGVPPRQSVPEGHRRFKLNQEPRSISSLIADSGLPSIEFVTDCVRFRQHLTVTFEGVTEPCLIFRCTGWGCPGCPMSVSKASVEYLDTVSVLGIVQRWGFLWFGTSCFY